MIRYSNNQVLLSPLYDFAPMMLDPLGIARISRWQNEEEQGRPHWRLVTDYLCELGCNKRDVILMWTELLQKVPQLPAYLHQSGVDAELIEQLHARINQVIKRLQEAL